MANIATKDILSTETDLQNFVYIRQRSQQYITYVHGVLEPLHLRREQTYQLEAKCLSLTSRFLAKYSLRRKRNTMRIVLHVILTENVKK